MSPDTPVLSVHPTGTPTAADLLGRVVAARDLDQ
jgi:hypothetical protein